MPELIIESRLNPKTCWTKTVGIDHTTDYQLFLQIWLKKSKQANQRIVLDNLYIVNKKNRVGDYPFNNSPNLLKNNNSKNSSVNLSPLIKQTNRDFNCITIKKHALMNKSRNNYSEPDSNTTTPTSEINFNEDLSKIQQSGRNNKCKKSNVEKSKLSNNNNKTIEFPSVKTNSSKISTSSFSSDDFILNRHNQTSKNSSPLYVNPLIISIPNHSNHSLSSSLRNTTNLNSIGHSMQDNHNIHNNTNSWSNLWRSGLPEQKLSMWLPKRLDILRSSKDSNNNENTHQIHKTDSFNVKNFQNLKFSSSTTDYKEFITDLKDSCGFKILQQKDNDISDRKFNSFNSSPVININNSISSASNTNLHNHGYWSINSSINSQENMNSIISKETSNLNQINSQSNHLSIMGCAYPFHRPPDIKRKTLAQLALIQKEKDYVTVISSDKNIDGQYIDPVLNASTEYMNRIIELSKLEDNTKRWERTKCKRRTRKKGIVGTQSSSQIDI